jgi:hypothetical protein
MKFNPPAIGHTMNDMPSNALTGVIKRMSNAGTPEQEYDIL